MTARDILDHRVYPQAKNKENMLSCPSLLAMHHGRLLGREHLAKKIIIDSTQRKIKSSKPQRVKYLHACVKVIESTFCDYRIFYGRVISP